MDNKYHSNYQAINSLMNKKNVGSSNEVKNTICFDITNSVGSEQAYMHT